MGVSVCSLQAEHRWQTKETSTRVYLGKSDSLSGSQGAERLKGSHIIKGPLQREWQLRKATCLELLAQLEVSSVGESPPVKCLLILQSPGGPGEPCKFPCVLNLVISFYELPSTLQEGMFQGSRARCILGFSSVIYASIDYFDDLTTRLSTTAGGTEGE